MIRLLNLSQLVFVGAGIVSTGRFLIWHTIDVDELDSPFLAVELRTDMVGSSRHGYLAGSNEARSLRIGTIRCEKDEWEAQQVENSSAVFPYSRDCSGPFGY
jgi:hypothetical protein